jgi:hypothetical protein
MKANTTIIEFPTTFLDKRKEFEETIKKMEKDAETREKIKAIFKEHPLKTGMSSGALIGSIGVLSKICLYNEPKSFIYVEHCLLYILFNIVFMGFMIKLASWVGLFDRSNKHLEVIDKMKRRWECQHPEPQHPAQNDEPQRESQGQDIPTRNVENRVSIR